MEYFNDIRKIMEHYGLDHQLCKLSEELGELAAAVARYRLGERDDVRTSLATEMADVQILIDQVVWKLGLASEVNNEMIYKVGRQLERMKEEKSVTEC